ncbi:Ger(x)C family spore germination protein [Thermanaeromonas sp. C210]|uniref:Ger(x)C family spore germination protein n=1 Tax=Thermanaeromonas sp. C210 TaxID=2731925 RepID=UPI00155C4A1B|nr:Ger(x)C family spore germination protein [Thermanaeromonas sp. C210]GFN24201.1 germination protein GerAC [Thermanaeromonas sp. C210]
MLKRATAFLAAGLFLMLTTGCWDRREINDLAFTSCFAFDVEGEERIATAEIVRPAAVAGGGEGGGGGGTGAALPQRNVILASERGDTLFGAGRRLALRLPRRTYVAHTDAVLVGEELARRGLREVLDHLERHQEFRRTAYILVTRGSARDVLVAAQGGLEATLGREITGLSRWVRTSGFGIVPTIHDVIVELSAGASAALIPVLEISAQPLPPSPGAATSGNAASGGSGQQGAVRVPDPEMLRTVSLKGAGLFHQDRLVGWLDEHQTRGWAWARNQVRRAILELECPEDKKKVSVEITDSQGKVQIQTSKGELQGIITVKVEGNLLEQQCLHDLTAVEVLRILESQAAAAIAGEINSAVAQAKQAGADVFDFGGALYRQEPQLWKQLKARWPEEFKKLPIAVQVEAKIRRTGLSLKPWQPGAR